MRTSPSFSGAARSRLLGLKVMIVVLTASALVAASPWESQPVTSEADDFLPRSTFVFEGTVRRVKASTVKLIPAGDDTAVVRVDRVLKGADTVGDFTGEDVTVVLQRPLSAPRDRRFTFFTNPKVSSKSLAVEEVGHVALSEGVAPAKGTTDAKDRVAKAESEAEAKRLQDHIALADLIVAGQVTATKPVARDENRPPPSEHDPEWWEATIKVQVVEKGQAGATLTAYYPHSDDIRWFAAPKLHEIQGKDRVFLFHARLNPQAEAIGEEKERDRFDIEGLKILDPADVQPVEKRDQIRAMIKR
jgi:hypothetical protein